MIRCHSERSEAATQPLKAFRGEARHSVVSDCSRRRVGGADASHSEAATAKHGPRYKLSLIVCYGAGLGAGVFDSRFVVCSSVVWLLSLLEVFLDL